MNQELHDCYTRLLNAFGSSYNIKQFHPCDDFLKAHLEFFEESEKYVLSRKANLWTTKGEEFISVYQVSNLSLPLLKDLLSRSRTDHEPNLHIGSGHMYSYITSIIICESMDLDACTYLSHYKERKNYFFSLHGWLECHAICIQPTTSRILANPDGKLMAKGLKRYI